MDLALEITKRCKESVREMGQGVERQKSKQKKKWKRNMIALKKQIDGGDKKDYLLSITVKKKQK